jgi:tripartite-type tricarboxylate transporter receptor subunit TctC
VTRLHRELVRAVEKPKTREVFATQGAQPMTMTPANFARRIDSEVKQWRDLVARVGIKVD